MNTPTYFDALRAICQPIRAVDWPRSLDPVRALLSALGSPQEKFPCMVVTGSVGKGTTCGQIAAGINQPGVGLYTSPHLHSFRERFVIDGQMISQAEFIEAANAVVQAASGLSYTYSTFELATALTFWWFARRGVSLAVLEVSIGGRWDAVNVVDNLLACFTTIEREHTAMLGGSLSAIAWTKAGIMQPGGRALSVAQPPEVESVLRHEADFKRTSLSFVENEPLSSTALHALVANGLIPAESLEPHPQPIHLPGRLEVVTIAGKTILIDGGHTPLAAQRLLEHINGLVGWQEPVRLIVGMLRDKSAPDFLNIFDRPLTTIIFTEAPGHRAFTAEMLASQTNFQRVNTQIVPLLRDALEQIKTATENLIVITGSLRLAAATREAYGLLSAEEIAEAAATRTIFEGADYLGKLV